ncbi:hypothetical protein HTZ85_08705 [Escherichia coli]|nr:hypothetical protein [Escherichia coli]
MNYGRRVGKCCLSAFKIATKSNHKSRLQHIFSDLHTDNDLSCLSGGSSSMRPGDLSQKGIEQKSSAVNKAIRFEITLMKFLYQKLVIALTVHNETILCK